MQQLDVIVLKHLADQLHEQLVGSKVNRVQHLSRHEFSFGFWGGDLGRSDRLYIHLNPELPCCFIVPQAELNDFGFNDFKKPTGLCMLLRKHLNNARVEKVIALTGERVINIHLSAYNEMGNRTNLLLSLELMGKHSNMLLVDELNQNILGVAHTVSASMSRLREVGVNLSYVPPPRPNDRPFLFSVSEKELSKSVHPQAVWCTVLTGCSNSETSVEISVDTVIARLMEAFWGIGPRQLRSFVEASRDAGSLYGLLQRVNDKDAWQGQIHKTYSRFTLLGETLDESEQGDWLETQSPGNLVARYCAENLRRSRLRQRVGLWKEKIKRQQKKLQKRLDEQTPVSPEELETIRHKGDLLIGAYSTGDLSGVPLAQVVEVVDYLTGKPVNISVTPELSWPDNAQRYYKKAKKEKSRQKGYELAKTEIGAQQEYLAELAQLLLQAEVLPDIAALELDLHAVGLIKTSKLKHRLPERKASKKARKSDKNAKPNLKVGVMELVSSDGFVLLVGKSGQANANLVGRLSQADDLWLHVHQSPGSHVIIKTEKQEVPEQTLLEAAQLAVHYSAARYGKNVPVLYTLIRYVRKIPGSHPGHVNYKQEQTLFVTPDALVLQGFLATSEK